MIAPRRTASFTATVPGLDLKLRALAVVAPEAVDRGLQAGIQAATIDVQGQARRYLEGEVLNRRTGRLWRSIHAETFRRMGRVVGIVGTNVKYAAIHEFGGVIRPKSADGFLAWQRAGRNEKTGRFQTTTVFAKEVTMPARPYLSRAFTARKKIVGDLIHRAIRRELLGPGLFPPAPVVAAGQRKGVGFDAD